MKKETPGIIINSLTLIVAVATCISTFAIQSKQNQISIKQNKFEQQMSLSGDNKKDDLKSLMKIVSDVEVLESSVGSLNANDSEKLVEAKKETVTLKNSFYFYLDQDNKQWGEFDKVLTDKLNTIYSEINNKNSLPNTGGDDSNLEEKWTNYMKQEKLIIENYKTIN